MNICYYLVSYLCYLVSYLVNGRGKPPGPCCSGVKALVATVATSADKKTAC
ncbi:hypothetical protein AAHE18_17G153200 [Arachis hypogaea]